MARKKKAMARKKKAMARKKKAMARKKKAVAYNTAKEPASIISDADFAASRHFILSEPVFCPKHIQQDPLL
jgi:hypothetical protein